MNEEERIFNDEDMQKLYSDWDKFSNQQKAKLILKKLEKEDQAKTEEKPKQEKPKQEKQTLNDEIINGHNCPYGNMLNDHEKETYNGLVPKQNPMIGFTLLLAVLGIIIIIFYTVYKNQKINEFNFQFYKEYVNPKGKYEK